MMPDALAAYYRESGMCAREAYTKARRAFSGSETSYTRDPYKYSRLKKKNYGLTKGKSCR